MNIGAGIVIHRIAGKDFTTLAEIDRICEQCRVPSNHPVSGSANGPVDRRSMHAARNRELSFHPPLK